MLAFDSLEVRAVTNNQSMPHADRCVGYRSSCRPLDTCITIAASAARSSVCGPQVRLTGGPVLLMASSCPMAFKAARPSRLLGGPTLPAGLRLNSK